MGCGIVDGIDRFVPLDVRIINDNVLNWHSIIDTLFVPCPISLINQREALIATCFS